MQNNLIDFDNPEAAFKKVESSSPQRSKTLWDVDSEDVEQVVNSSPKALILEDLPTATIVQKGAHEVTHTPKELRMNLSYWFN